MDISELLVNQAATDPAVGKSVGQVGKVAEAGGLRAGADIDVTDERRKKVARDFESVFIHEILKRMEDTIPVSDMADQSSKQIKSMYWSYMAQAIADRGGFGLWKNIYEAMVATGSDAGGEQQNQAVRQILDKRV